MNNDIRASILMLIILFSFIFFCIGGTYERRVWKERILSDRWVQAVRAEYNAKNMVEKARE